MVDIGWNPIRLYHFEPQARRTGLHNENHVVVDTIIGAQELVKELQNDIFGADYDFKLEPALGLSIYRNGKVVVAKKVSHLLRILFKPLPIIELQTALYVKDEGELHRCIVTGFEHEHGKYFRIRLEPSEV